MTKPKLFIGSSGRAKPIVQKIILSLQEKWLDVLPWWKAFPLSAFTLEALIDASKTCDFAAFVFAADDELAAAEGTRVVTRDNVVLEYALFTGKLGRERTIIFEQDGVKMPSDLLAVTTIRFSTEENAQEAQIAEGLSSALAKWEPLGSAHSGKISPIASFGLSKTLLDEKERLDEVLHKLAVPPGRENEDGLPHTDLDSLESCRSAYLEALALVKDKFFTTTFLSSGFWSEPNEKVKIIGANSQLAKRLRKAGKPPPRRIFLLDRSVDDYIREEVAYRNHLRQHGNAGRLRRREVSFNTVNDNIRKLQRDGCELRICYDVEDYKVFKTKLHFDYYDSELAVYDEFRIDIFGGGSTGVINRVRCYPSQMSSFDQYLDAATSFFDKLWEKGRPMDAFMDRLSDEIRASEERIDYEPNWLALYEYSLNDNDSRLKATELDYAVAAVRHYFPAGRIERCLDIGTCTARYPQQLGEAFPDCSEFIGIDNDVDCIRFAQFRCAGKARIRVEQEDFTKVGSSGIEGPFDLITCMLGTLSHFGRDRQDDRRDTLQRCLERMSKLLSPGGLLLIGCWSESAAKNRDLLSIYSEYDSKRLASWTPSADELRARLDLVGLYGQQWRVHTRLDLWLCRKDHSRSSFPPRPNSSSWRAPPTSSV